MNAEQHFRGKIGAMISQGFVIDSVRDQLELKGVSEVWGGPSTDAHPAWYLWLTISPGAFKLRLEQTENLGTTAAPVLRGVLSIKYYPSPHEPAFKHFSEDERALIEGPLFDSTNTPSFDGQDRIPEPLFYVGSMEFIDDVAGGQAYLTYSSLDRMDFRDLADEPGDGALSLREAATSAASARRQRPAWDLGYPLFDAFVGLHSFLTQKAPTRVVLSRQPGFEFVETVSGCFDCRDTTEPAFKSLLVVCSTEVGETPSPIEERMCSELLAEPWIPIFDCQARCACDGNDHRHDDHDRACGCDAGDGRRSHDHFFRNVEVGEATWEVPLAFNELWWRLATAEHVANSMPCGCH